MKFTKTILALTAVLPITLSAVAASKFEDSFADLKVVNNHFDENVKNGFGDCVRSRWHNNKKITVMTNECDHTQTEMIFYTLNSSHLSERDKQHLNSIVGKMVKGKKVVVEGHTDYTGNYGYNFKLSQKRADVVKDELVKYGVSPSDIEIQAKSFSELLIDTDEGVKEMKNRRVEITFFMKK